MVLFSRAIFEIDDIVNKIALPNNHCGAHSPDGYHPTDATKSKVDAALYPSGVAPRDGCPDWTHLRLFIEFKKGGTENDPFNDKGDHSEAWAQSRQRVRGQLLAYATTTFQYQHRTSLYSLLINGDEFRAMYWDRSGLIVSEATNYVEDPNSLLRFLWAFASLSGEQQGIDPTATLLLPTSDDYKLMDAWAIANPALDMPFHEHADVTDFPDTESAASLGPAASTRQKSKQPTHPVFKFVRDLFRDYLVKGWPRYKLTIGEGSGKREFLVAKPVFMSKSMFGRGTRGYIACDIETNQFVWLKDSWRPFYQGVEPEGNYLETMATKPGLRLTVPTVVAHGDVLQQTTSVVEYYKADQSQSTTPSADVQSAEVHSVEPARGKKRPREEEEAAEKSDESEESRTFIHYRLAVNEVCLPMESFTRGKQLVRLILDCIYSKHEPFVRCTLLTAPFHSAFRCLRPLRSATSRYQYWEYAYQALYRGGRKWLEASAMEGVLDRLGAREVCAQRQVAAAGQAAGTDGACSVLTPSPSLSSADMVFRGHGSSCLLHTSETLDVPSGSQMNSSRSFTPSSIMRSAISDIPSAKGSRPS